MKLCEASCPQPCSVEGASWPTPDGQGHLGCSRQLAPFVPGKEWAAGSSSGFPIQQGVGGALRALGEPVPMGVGWAPCARSSHLGLRGQPNSSPVPEPRCAPRFPGTWGPLVQGQAWMAATRGYSPLQRGA